MERARIPTYHPPLNREMALVGEMAHLTQAALAKRRGQVHLYLVDGDGTQAVDNRY